MDHYIDIRLRPDPEFPATILLNALFSKLHRGLVAQGQNNIGVSFPESGNSKQSLGTHLRLHGTAAALDKLAAQDWLTGIRDHVSVSAPGLVPENARHRIVRRVQAQSNPERLRRRLMARKGISAEEARAAIPDQVAERLNLPYIVLNSRTTGQQFRLFIDHMPVQASPQSGSFSAYGLSSNATVPWF